VQLEKTVFPKVEQRSEEIQVSLRCLIVAAGDPWHARCAL
jgi:hypothetical protein